MAILLGTFSERRTWGAIGAPDPHFFALPHKNPRQRLADLPRSEQHMQFFRHRLNSRYGGKPAAVVRKEHHIHGISF